MSRLIDRDDMIKSLMDRTFYDEEGYIIDDYEERLKIAKSFVNPVSTVDAVPVSYIYKRINLLHEMAEHDFEANGGYIGEAHIAEYELENLLTDWRTEQEKQNG